jgi:hypothetical protein
MRVTVNEVNSQREWVLGILESERKTAEAERKVHEGQLKEAAETIEYYRNRPLWRIVASRVRARLISLLQYRLQVSTLSYRLRVSVHRFRALTYKMRTKLGLARIRIRLGLVKESPPPNGSA